MASKDSEAKAKENITKIDPILLVDSRVQLKIKI